MALTAGHGGDALHAVADRQKPPSASAPTSTTSPATSWPSVVSRVMLTWPFFLIFTSVPQVEQFLTLIFTSSGPALGLGHVLEPDVLGGVEAQCLHGRDSSTGELAARSVRLLPLTVAGITGLKPHQSGQNLCPNAWQRARLAVYWGT